MNLIRTLFAFVLASGLAIAGCGGAGGGGVAAISGGGGIGGTGIVSTGTIDGFGSIFVNGVEYETTDSEVTLDGVASSEANLRLGMVVTVRGTVNEDGKTGTAEQVEFDDEVQGPVAAIEPGADGDSLLLTVLGVKVIAERTSTVFDDVSFQTLAVGDVVEVSGFVGSDQRLRATRIEKKSDFVAGTSEIELEGSVSGRTDTTFNLNGFVVDYSNADLSEIDGGVIADGMQVEVHGTLTDDVILASKVEGEDDPAAGFEDEEKISLQGAITNYVAASSFSINGIAVNASGAEREPAGLVLANGVVVEAEGVWNGTVLMAEKVKSRRGLIELDAKVTSVDVARGSITVAYIGGAVTVQTDSRTQLDDDTGAAEPLALADLASGNFLEVEAERVGDALIASRVRRADVDDDVLQAQVDSFTTGQEITLLGISFNTVGTDFKNRNNGEISAETFFAALQVGDLVKVTDKEPADGIADEVEFEHDDIVDGPDDDEECASGSSSDDGCNPGDDGECTDGSSGSEDGCNPGDDSECTDGSSGSEGVCNPGDDGECTDGSGSDDACNPDDGDVTASETG